MINHCYFSFWHIVDVSLLFSIHFTTRNNSFFLLLLQGEQIYNENGGNHQMLSIKIFLFCTPSGVKSVHDVRLLINLK